jgi:hypothetical protein
MPGSNFRVVEEAKLLNPRRVKLLRYTGCPSPVLTSHLIAARAESGLDADEPGND